MESRKLIIKTTKYVFICILNNLLKYIGKLVNQIHKIHFNKYQDLSNLHNKAQMVFTI